MIRFFGGILILFSSSMLGFLKAATFKERPREIRQIISLLKKLETEIAFTATPLPEGLCKIGNKSGGKIGNMFYEIGMTLENNKEEMVRETFNRVINKRFSETALHNDEKNILYFLSEVLGTSDRESQLRYIKDSIEQFRHQQEWAEILREKNEKIWKNVGVLGGILLILLLY